MQVVIPTALGSSEDRLSHFAFVFAFLASLTGLVSIATSHVCLGISLALLLVSKTPLRMPPLVLPLAGFIGLTIVSMVASDDPLAGWPQLKKFYVFAFLVVLYSLFRSVDQAQRLYQAWFVAALFAAGLSMAQFIYKWSRLQATGGDFDTGYMGDRITGFFSHWMTFSEVILLVFVVLLSYLMFSDSARSRTRAIWAGVAIALAVALLLDIHSKCLAGSGGLGRVLDLALEKEAAARRSSAGGCPDADCARGGTAPYPVHRQPGRQFRPAHHVADRLANGSGASLAGSGADARGRAL